MDQERIRERTRKNAEIAVKIGQGDGETM